MGSEMCIRDSIYNDQTFYYVTVSQGSGKRIQPFIQTTQPSEEIITSFVDTKYHELDEENLAFVGRRWFGDNFNVENEKQFNFNFPNLISSLPVSIKIIAASASDSASSMSVAINGAQQTVLNFPGVANGGSLVNEVVFSDNLSVASEDVLFNFNYDNLGNPINEAFLDYISVKACLLYTSPSPRDS